ncbi:MAG: amidohydrolase family protein [Chlorobi bacterium]|nr:amidohydrolase family protein [Chlorobiota bacterium]
MNTLTDYAGKNIFAEKTNAISANPFERMNDGVKQVLDKNNYAFDVHCHIFDKDSVPIPYSFIRKEHHLNAIRKTRRKINIIELFSNHDNGGIDDFFRILNLHNMHDVYEELTSVYKNSKKEMIYCPLMMNMKYGWSKYPIKKSFDRQIDEVKGLIKLNLPILPFVAMDPNDPDIYNQFLKAFTGDNPFFGIKIYPALGYLPSHPVLMDIYKVCEEKNIPVTTHCGGNIIFSFKKEIHYEGFKIVNSEGKQVLEKYSGKINQPFVANFFNKPEHWQPVLFKYPNLKLNFGHFGGIKAWKFMRKKRRNIIIDMIKQYPNVYADISFDIHKKKLFPRFVKAFNNQQVKAKVMFGTDFYMITPFGDLPKMINDFSNSLGDDLSQLLKTENPYRFLFKINKPNIT